MQPKKPGRRAAWVIQLDLERSRAAAAPVGTLEGVESGRRQPVAGWSSLRIALSREAGLPLPEDDG